uniref:CCHC-type domain-containing protein n=1 Tax=Plectus sambesii TaxID=2011161 RepID=A0A914VEY6_9BILA
MSELGDLEILDLDRGEDLDGVESLDDDVEIIEPQGEKVKEEVGQGDGWDEPRASPQQGQHEAGPEERLEQAERQIVQHKGRINDLERTIWDLKGQGRPQYYCGPGQQWDHGNEEQKEIRFRFTASGAPICAHCYQPNHMRRECPQRHAESSGSSDQYNGGFGQGTQSFG